MTDVLTADPLPWSICLAYAVATIWHFRVEWGSRSSPPVWQWQTESYWWKAHERVVTRSRGRQDALVALILGLECVVFGLSTSFWFFAIFSMDLADALRHGQQYCRLQKRLGGRYFSTAVMRLNWRARGGSDPGSLYFATAALRVFVSGCGAMVFTLSAADLGASPVVVLYWLPGLALSLGGWWQLARKAHREEHWVV